MIAAATSVTASTTTTAGRRSVVRGWTAALLKRAPPPPVAAGQVVGLRGAGRAGRVGDRLRGIGEQAIDGGPLRLDLGAGGEQRRIAGDRVAEQALVGPGRVALGRLA